MPAEQVMERVADDVAQSTAAPTRSANQPAPTTSCDERIDRTYSPDPDRRCDRYRLVTPYLLRL